ncbi:40s ribosomal protein s5-1 [Hordeum vulgare]|nr:40s ribosomal protein s5-1 [Hordeum vulgare]
METNLEAMEKQVFKCQGMVERGLNANHMMITEFTNKQRIDANDIGKHLYRLYDRIDQLQAQIYDLQNQNTHEEALADANARVAHKWAAAVEEYNDELARREAFLQRKYGAHLEEASVLWDHSKGLKPPWKAPP